MMIVWDGVKMKTCVEMMAKTEDLEQFITTIKRRCGGVEVFAGYSLGASCHHTSEARLRDSHELS